MMNENDVAPAGTGQEGAGTPAGVKQDIPVKPPDKVDQIANRAAQKGLNREHNSDPTVFTK